MLLDGRQVRDGSLLTADIVIIGGGFAGIVLALELSEAGHDVLILESGGKTADVATSALNDGLYRGLEYEFSEGARSRYLGGSSNCWAGWCRPFDAQDFEQRQWIAASGWPITRKDLSEYYKRTHHYLRLGPYQYDTDSFVDAIDRRDVRRYPFNGGQVEDSLSQFSPPTRIASDRAEQLARSTRVRVLQHTNVVNIEVPVNGRDVRFVHCQTLAGNSFQATGKQYCLATGGIENARLLLTSNRTRTAGLGNEHDNVGRYFMDHPRIRSGTVDLAPQWRNNLLYDAKFNLHNPRLTAWGTRVAAAMRLSRRTQEEEGLTDALVWLMSEFHGENSSTYHSLVRLRRHLVYRTPPTTPLHKDLTNVIGHPQDAVLYATARRFRPHWLVKRVRLQAIVEPEPNPSSRVTLSSDERDALGMPRVVVDWRLTDRVRRTFDRNFELVGAALENAGVARVILDEPVSNRTDWPDTFERRGTWHHMGTTRMHDDPKQGVVDANCRLHSVENLFVAGSSVFTTGGANYPTQTLLALALRLSDHLKDKLRPDTVHAAESDAQGIPASLPAEPL